MLVYLREWHQRLPPEVLATVLIREWMCSVVETQSLRMVRFARTSNRSRKELSACETSFSNAQEVTAAGEMFYRDELGQLLLDHNPLDDPDVRAHFEPSDELVLDHVSLTQSMGVPAEYHDMMYECIHTHRPVAMIGHDADWMIDFRYE
jgi:hypothetical protein